MSRPGSVKRVRVAAALVAGLVGGSILISPAGAHVGSTVSHLVAHMKNTFHTKAEADAKFVPAASFFTYKQTLLPGDVEPLGQFGNFRLRGRCEGDGTSMRVRVQIRTTVDGAVLRGEESGHFRPLNTGDGWVRWSAGWYNDEGAPRLNNPVEPAHAIGPDGTAIYGTSTLGANIPEGTCTVAGFIINM